MKRVSLKLLSWFSALLLSIGTATASSLDDPIRVEAFVDGLVNPLMLNHDSPSGVVAVAKDGNLLVAKGYGYQDIENRLAVNPEKTLFRPGSVSKLFTWVAVMQQVEQGRLELDTDVNQYLKTFKIKETYDQPITLRHIFTHTAGFEEGALAYLILQSPDNILPLDEAMARLQLGRVNPPGAQTAYSNYATALAGLIVQNVSGVPFNQYIEQNIFQPLGMNNSTFEEPLPERLKPQMAKSYAVEAGKFVEKPFELVSNFGPAGSLSSSGTDMLRFAQAILNGGELDGNRILKEETVDQMLSKQFSHDDRLLGMGLGFYANDLAGHEVWGHGGDLQWFHSQLGIDRENGLAFFVSFSGAGGRVPRSAFAPTLYEEFVSRAESTVPAAPQDFAERSGKYAGSYGFWRSNFNNFEKVLGLSGAIEVAPTGDNTLMVAMADKAKQYVEVDTNLFRALDSSTTLASGINPELLAFQENDQGEITGFVMDGFPFMSLRKLPFYDTSTFNFALLALSVLIFIAVLLRRYYQRRTVRTMPAAEKSATRAAVYAAAAHLAVLVIGAVVLATVMENLFEGVPLSLKLWLILPIVASLLTAYLVYRNIGVWQQGVFNGVLPRVRFTAVTLGAVFMTWFYYYWNMLGYHFL
ncbi:serine hydrolase [Microbulbifer bruguierae]|uniref:Serine hydrolase n=1 Tax=Microbulbifer bruguierae TaxID=3029061 RepID=A0ABY8NG34_9GAMM|nr:serine hydrolase domain-containing protein [Microbulbifer bruguierae]WGL17888.1 serine hydrolase [Microbulbifer bruguierae]